MNVLMNNQELMVEEWAKGSVNVCLLVGHAGAYDEGDDDIIV